MTTVSRRRTLKTAAALAAAGAFADEAGAAPAKRPNIIVILADDLGYGDLGCFGGRRIRTPRLDKMAREGVRLTNFFSSANVCTPSRAGLLTGRYPVRSGMSVGVVYPHSTYGLPQSEITIAKVLRDAGYRTSMLGKWHLGSVADSWPTRHGFQSFWGVPYSNDMSPFPLYRDETVLEAETVQESFAARMADEAQKVIAAPGDAPFFLYVAPIAPHVPLRPGPDFRGKSGAGLYGDFVEELDWTVGAILDALRASGKDRDTLVIFTSDNGPWWEGSSGDRRDRKGSTWEGGYAVPFIARWPGQIAARRTSDAISINCDLFPTLAAIAGAPLPAGVEIDGRDIRALLNGDHHSPHDHLFFFANAQIAAVRNQDWRLVLRAYYLTFEAPLERLNARLLFNVTADPGETVNLIDRHPDIAAKLQAAADAARQAFADLPQQRTDPFARNAAPVLPNWPAAQ
jgi:arylsulfatase A